MGYEVDWVLCIGYRAADIDVDGLPQGWERFDHIDVAHEEPFIGVRLYQTRPGYVWNHECSSGFAPDLLRKTFKRVAKQARAAGIGDPPSLFTIRNHV